MAPNSVWRWEVGQHEPSREALGSLARLYTRPVEWFLASGSRQGSTGESSAVSITDPVYQASVDALREAWPNLTAEQRRTTREFIRLLQDASRDQAESGG